MTDVERIADSIPRKDPSDNSNAAACQNEKPVVNETEEEELRVAHVQVNNPSIKDQPSGQLDKHMHETETEDDDPEKGQHDAMEDQKPSVANDTTKEGKEIDNKEVAETDDLALPTKPIKRARTGYFIFADEKRAQVQAQHPGETVGVLARTLGQMWAALTEEERNVYQQKSAMERERVAQELSKYSLEGVDLDKINGNSSSNKPVDPCALTFPVARIRKICRLDHEVHGISKEAALLITKCTELATVKLGRECVKVAQLQNRRKLLPEDVAQVCATREQFLFLRDDVKDLVRDQKKTLDKPKPSPSALAVAASANMKPMTAFFTPK